MKPVFIPFTALLLLIFSCGKNDEKVDGVQQTQEEKAKLKAIPELIELVPEYQDTIDQWTFYKLLEVEMGKFRKQRMSGIQLSVDELLRLEKELSQNEFPEKFNIPAVKSRFIVLRTYLLETKTLLDEKAPREVINAQQLKIVETFNALKKQFIEALRPKVYEGVLEKADSLKINNEFEEFKEID